MWLTKLFLRSTRRSARRFPPWSRRNWWITRTKTSSTPILLTARPGPRLRRRRGGPTSTTAITTTATTRPGTSPLPKYVFQDPYQLLIMISPCFHWVAGWSHLMDNGHLYKGKDCCIFIHIQFLCGDLGHPFTGFWNLQKGITSAWILGAQMSPLRGARFRKYH